MRQFIGSEARPTTVRDFLLAYAEPRVAEAAIRVGKAERWMHDHPGEDAQMRYADALANWGEAGGYEIEVVFDQCTDAAFGQGYPECAERKIETLSGGERKRLALEVIFRSRFDTVMLDEPDNALDIDGQGWLEDAIAASPKTVLFVSHDRTVLDRAATRIVTLEGRAAWTHHGGFSSYAEARDARVDRLDQDHRRYEEEHRRLSEMVKEMRRKSAYNDNWASKARSASTGSTGSRSARSRPTRPTCRTSGCGSTAGAPARWRSGCSGLSIAGIVGPFDAEIWFGERIGVIGPNGTGKTHFMRLLAGEEIAHEGEWKLGARVEPALFAQLHERADVADLPIVEVLRKRGMTMTESMAALRRYEIDQAGRNPFELLSGGQQARFQLLLMEIDSPTMLLLDEPTDNLDVASADALEDAARPLRGHGDRGDARPLVHAAIDRFLFFDDDGSVRELLESPYDLAVDDRRGRDDRRVGADRRADDPRPARPDGCGGRAVGAARSERKRQDDGPLADGCPAPALRRRGMGARRTVGRTDVRALRQRIGHVSHRLAEELPGRRSVLETVLTGRDGVLVPWGRTFDATARAEAVGVARDGRLCGACRAAARHLLPRRAPACPHRPGVVRRARAAAVRRAGRGARPTCARAVGRRHGRRRGRRARPYWPPITSRRFRRPRRTRRCCVRDASSPLARSRRCLPTRRCRRASDCRSPCNDTPAAGRQAASQEEVVSEHKELPPGGTKVDQRSALAPMASTRGRRAATRSRCPLGASRPAGRSICTSAW